MEIPLLSNIELFDLKSWRLESETVKTYYVYCADFSVLSNQSYSAGSSAEVVVSIFYTPVC